MNIELDAYTRRARVAPLFVVIAPVVLGLIPWVPGSVALEFGLAGVVFAVGVPVLLAQLGGAAGEKKEKALWESWGGAPTTQLLRHRSAGNPVVLRRRHTRLQELFPDVVLPSEEDERKDAVTADFAYEAAVKRLIAATRDQKVFRLVFIENAGYGFRRNLWAMKAIGLTVAGLALAACIVHVVLAITEETAVDVGVGCGVGSLLLGLAMFFFVTPAWVRRRANEYAERLLEAVETLR